MRLITLLLIVNLLQVSAVGYSQNTRLDLNMTNASIKEVLGAIENQSSFKFVYRDEDVENKKVSLKSEGKSIDEVLTALLTNTGTIYRILDNHLVVIAPVNSLQQKVTGRITDASTNEPLVGVNVIVEGTTVGSTTDNEGKFSVDVPGSNSVLVITYIGYITEKVKLAGQSTIDVKLVPDVTKLDEVLVIGYGIRKKESVTGAISGVTSEDMDRVHASTVSAALAGKIAGVSFRQTDGRPGSGATIQIRNMGTPLYVIDGFQKDEGTFNNISPNDIESITILKDASASIYGSRGANGVVLVSTKRGKIGSRNSVNVDAYTGWQNWSRFPKTTNAYEWMTGKADAEMNSLAHTTGITAAELDKWKTGTEKGYQSFDWYKFIIKPNSPLSSISVNTQGGSERINYYVSVSRLFQNSVLGREFTFARTNMASSVEAKVSKNLKVGMQVTGRIETKDNPGVPGGDDYWAPRFALFRNRPTERPYANDNPAYINDIGHNDTNWALFSKSTSGYWTEDWRVFQTNFNAEYQLPIKGLTASGKYSYYLADKVMNGHEYTYQTYSYNETNKTYDKAFAMSNPWRERGTHKNIETVLQGNLNYANTFGKHTFGATLVAERIERKEFDTWVHAVPSTNVLPLLYFDNIDTYNDSQIEQARIGYVGRFNYDFARKYYFEFSAREDASWKFVTDKRWGFFPSVSAGWRISEENFFKSLSGLSNVVSDFKIRASYGILGDDNVGDDINNFAYMSGYNYNTSTNIIDGNIVKGSRYRGEPVTNISWFTSKITDIGADYNLFNGTITGTLDYFYRKRTGLRGTKWDVLVPQELGYSLPDENVNSDAVMGGDGAIFYNKKSGELTYSLGFNFGFARNKNLDTYKPRFASQYDQYFNSSENRWAGTYWGYKCIGQFQSVDQINDYKIDNDGKGNKTMLPGDLMYEDTNNDGKINGDDTRPIGYARDKNPTVNYGFNFTMAYKGIDFKADFSGGTMYSYNREWEMRVSFQNTGNLLSQLYDDRWHRKDILDVNSPWVSGKYPALRWNDGGHSNYRNSTFWLTNVRYLRMRTLELGYTLPKAWSQKVLMEKARIYINAYNLFSLDNLSKAGIEPEIMDTNGLQYPQNKFVNIGVNLTF
jgi:TonB-linked SusC/RagA family outer membrane protein